VPPTTEKQDRLFRVGYVLMWLAIGDMIATFATYVAGNVFVSKLLAVPMLLILGATLLVGRALQKTGPPFDVVRWYWPWKSRH